MVEKVYVYKWVVWDHPRKPNFNGAEVRGRMGYYIPHKTMIWLLILALTLVYLRQLNFPQGTWSILIGLMVNTMYSLSYYDFTFHMLCCMTIISTSGVLSNVMLTRCIILLDACIYVILQSVVQIWFALTHWGRNKTDAISQTTSLSAFLKWKCLNFD